MEFRLRHSDNTYRWYELEAASVESADRRNVRCVGLLRDITDPKRTHERLLQDAVRCRVTDLPNREIFLDRLKVAGERSKNEPDIRPTIIFIDLDRFKEINDYARCPMAMNTQIMRGRMKVEVTVVRQSVYESTVGPSGGGRAHRADTRPAAFRRGRGWTDQPHPLHLAEGR